MNMLTKKVMILNQKWAVIVKKYLLLIIVVINSLFLSSCKYINDFTPLEQNQYPKELYKIINEISLEVMPANLTVYAHGYYSRFGLGTPNIVNQGSGVIFHSDDQYYYFLTSNHVVYISDDYKTKNYYVNDYKNNEYQAFYVYSHPNYDLAIFKFVKTNNLTVLNISLKDPEKDEIVFSIGQPKNQKNTITVGSVLKYDVPVCKECDSIRSNVTFLCIIHDAIINHGSSGGMLINLKKEVVGINTFGSLTNNQGIAVPASKIREFIELANNQ